MKTAALAHGRAGHDGESSGKLSILLPSISTYPYKLEVPSLLQIRKFVCNDLLLNLLHSLSIADMGMKKASHAWPKSESSKHL